MSNYARGDFDSRYGTIHMSNPGPFKAYANMQTYAQTSTRSVQLQGPALKAFRAAEWRITPRYMRRKNKVRHILLTGSYRSYAYQDALYRSDSSGRYADPDGSMHVEALAIDIDQGQGASRLAAIRRALEAEGWHYGVPGEPWHASFRLSG